MDDRLISFLSGFVTPERLRNFDAVLEWRSRYITIVLEDIYQPHNASAVLRSCECFGVQDVHIIENRNKYRLSPDVALGSAKWLSLYRHNRSKNNSLPALKYLREDGYRIVATLPGTPDCATPENIDLSKGKLALLFGTEMQGLSKELLENADETLCIPMFGFTGSLNISVSAAVIIQRLMHRLRISEIPWQLSPEEKNELKLQWLKHSVKKSGVLIKQFFEKIV